MNIRLQHIARNQKAALEQLFRLLIGNQNQLLGLFIRAAFHLFNHLLPIAR